MRTRFIRFIVSSILMICMLFSSVTTSSAKKIKLEGYEYLHMSVGQYVYAYNLVYRVNGQKKEFCKNINGFDVKSKNEDVLDYDEATGLVAAKSAGETELVVKKNGKEFIIRFYISADEPYDKKELEWINDKTDTLSRKYPEYSYLSGKGSAFMKSWCLLLKRLGGYEFGLERALWPNNDFDLAYEDDYFRYGQLGLAGQYTFHYLDSYYSYQIIRDSREFFRLNGYAKKYLKAQQEKSEPLRIKSAKMKLVESVGGGYYAKIDITLKSPLTIKQCLMGYDLEKSIPPSSSWKKDLRAEYYIRGYRIYKSGRTQYVDDGYLEGKVGSSKLSASLWVPKKDLNFKLVIEPMYETGSWKKVSIKVSCKS